MMRAGPEPRTEGAGISEATDSVGSEQDARTTGTGWWDRVPGAVAVVGGLFFVGFGVWAMVAPQAFFDAVAVFEPYNQHFLQDIGAFQVGLGAVLLLAVGPAGHSALATALLGTGVGSALHVVSHVVGHDLGGTPSTDIPTFVVVSVVLLVTGAMALRRPSP